MDEARRVRLSKFLSYVLRHDPESIGLELEPGGWVQVEALLEAARAAGRRIGRDDLLNVIELSDKPRFELDPEGRAIRARYGHSVAVELDRQPTEPPEFLFHGTAKRFLGAILEHGLRARGRTWVHLSPDLATARQVGARHGQPIALRVAAGRMWEGGHQFYRAGPGVWLTETVPPDFLEQHNVEDSRG